MKYHSDQSLDLNENFYICLFSCYNDPNTKDLKFKKQIMLLKFSETINVIENFQKQLISLKI